MISKDSNLFGLVLSGGNSTRMGQDKSQIRYHGKPQAEYLYDLLRALLPNTYVSVQPGQCADFTDRVIEDQFPSRGPINGIMSAMKQHPGHAWLVLACDLPLISSHTIRQLIAERDPSRVATAFASRESGLPEPLVAIWEHTAWEGLERHHLMEGRNCPRKFLIHSDIKLIQPADDMELFNANHPEEYQKAKQLIG